MENKSFYKILSTGIHELTEAECLEAFQTVKLGIELILDERIEEEQKQSKIARAKKAIQGLGTKLNSTKKS